MGICCLDVLALAGFLFVMADRERIRQRYGIKGSGATDYYSSCCCGSCTIIQQEKEAVLMTKGGKKEPEAGEDAGYQLQQPMSYPQPQQ